MLPRDLSRLCWLYCFETNQTLPNILLSYSKSFCISKKPLILPLKTSKVFFGMIYEKAHQNVFVYHRSGQTLQEKKASSLFTLVTQHLTDEELEAFHLLKVEQKWIHYNKE